MERGIFVNDFKDQLEMKHQFSERPILWWSIVNCDTRFCLSQFCSFASRFYRNAKQLGMAYHKNELDDNNKTIQLTPKFEIGESIGTSFMDKMIAVWIMERLNLWRRLEWERLL